MFEVYDSGLRIRWEFHTYVQAHDFMKGNLERLFGAKLATSIEPNVPVLYNKHGHTMEIQCRALEAV